MRALSSFLFLVAGALALVAVATWPAWLLVNQLQTVPFHRVGNRVAMLGLAMGLVLVARRLDVADRAALGYATPRGIFLRELLQGLALGLLFMLPLSALMLLLDVRYILPGATLGALGIAILKGLLTGMVVSLMEETFLRGAMFSAVRRESGVLLAVVATSLLYAAVHFFSRYRIEPADVTALSGFDLVKGSLQALSQPRTIVDAFACLAAVGALLALVRHYTGSIAACIGLHAGWVAIMMATRSLTEVDETQDDAWLLSAHDGFVGYLTLGWTVIAAVPLLLFYRRWQRQGS